MRSMRGRLPAQRHPRQVLQRGQLATLRRIQSGPDQCARLPRRPATHCKSMSRTAPAAAYASRIARPTARATSVSGDQHGADRRRSSSSGAQEHRVLREAADGPTARTSNFANVRGAQFLQPLFEFSGACAGCGETPYLKMLSQLFGDRLQIANATGCSSIYGGNLPTTPWAKDRRRARAGVVATRCSKTMRSSGSVIAWRSTSRLSLPTRSRASLRPQIGEELVRALLEAPQITEFGLPHPA